jgi:hypothetical protein
MTMPMSATRDALADLQWNWGEAYQITGCGQHWLAQRKDDGRTLSANGPEELCKLMLEDYAAQPVFREAAPGWPAPSAHVQAAALRVAFPQYVVSVLANRGDKPRFEAVSRDGGSLYCLISDDALEIWRELHGQ